MDETLELTTQLVRLPSVTGKIEPNVVEALDGILRRHGYNTTLLPTLSGTHFLATVGDGSKHLAFVSHYDVVPAGEGWSSAPFEPTFQEGRLYGRGVCDMKGGLAAQIIGGKYLAAQGMKVSLFIAADEENQSEGMPALLDQCTERIDYALCGEPTSFLASGDAIKVGRRGVLQGKVIVHGKGGHAAYAETVDNPVHSLGDVIAALTWPRYDWNDDFPASSLSVTNVSAGTGVCNQVPQQATILFDARLSPETSPQQFESELRRELDKMNKGKYTLTITKNTPSYYTQDAAFRAIVSSAIEEMNGKRPEVNCLGGMSDARFFAWKGIPTLEVGLPFGNMHGADEFVVVEELDRLRQIYTAIGRKLLSL